MNKNDKNEPELSNNVKAVVEDRDGFAIGLDGSRTAKDIVDANGKAEHNDLPDFLKNETDAKNTGSGERNPDDDPELNPMVLDQIRQQGGNVNLVLEDGMTDYDIQIANKSMGGEQKLTEELRDGTGSRHEEIGKADEHCDPELISVKGFTDGMRTAGKAIDTADVTEVIGNIGGAALVGAAGAIDAVVALAQGDTNEAKAELAGGIVEAGIVAVPTLEYADAASLITTGETLSHKMAEAARNAVREKLNPQDEGKITEIGDEIIPYARGEISVSELGELSPSPVGINIEREESLTI